MKRVSCIFLALLMVIVMVAAVACTIDGGNNPPDGNPPTPPGDGGQGGGSVADVPEETDETYLSTVTAGTIDLSQLSSDTDIPQDVVTLSADEKKISSDGSYLLSGDYTDGISVAKGLTVHLYLSGANISKTDGIALETGKKCNVTLTVVNGTTNTISTSGSGGYNAIHVKGTFAINGNGTLTVTSAGKNAIKVSKSLQIVDVTLTANGANHAIACGSLAANNATINVNAGKD